MKWARQAHKSLGSVIKIRDRNKCKALPAVVCIIIYRGRVKRNITLGSYPRNNGFDSHFRNLYNNKEYYDYFNVEDRSYRIGETYNIYINPDKPFSNISESIWKCSLCILIISIVFLFISLIKTINLNIIKRDLRIFIKVLKKEEIDKEDLQIERK